MLWKLSEDEQPGGQWRDRTTVIAVICLLGFSIFSKRNRSYLHSFKYHNELGLFQSAGHNKRSVTQSHRLLVLIASVFIALSQFLKPAHIWFSLCTSKPSYRAGTSGISGSAPRCGDWSPENVYDFLMVTLSQQAELRPSATFSSSWAHVPSPPLFASVWKEKSRRIQQPRVKRHREVSSFIWGTWLKSQFPRSEAGGSGCRAGAY